MLGTAYYIGFRILEHFWSSEKPSTQFVLTILSSHRKASKLKISEGKLERNFCKRSSKLRLKLKNLSKTLLKNTKPQFDTFQASKSGLKCSVVVNCGK